MCSRYRRQHRRSFACRKSDSVDCVACTQEIRVRFLHSSPPSYGTGGDYSFRVPTTDKARVAIFLDYQNVLQRGHDLYGRGKESYQCVPEPSLVADMLAHQRDVPSEATSILVFRGRPDSRKEPTLASAHDKQKQ